MCPDSIRLVSAHREPTSLLLARWLSSQLEGREPQPTINSSAKGTLLLSKLTIPQADPLPSSNNGDFKDPQTGVIEHNATLSAVYEALVALDQQALFDYTLSSLKRTIANL